MVHFLPEKLTWHPQLNPWGKKIGKINEIWAMPCTPTPQLWVKAAWNVIPAAIFHAIKPSTTDYLIIRFGFGHHKARRKFFDFWDFSFLEHVPKSGVSWQVFKLGGLLARALWYIAVFDALVWGLYSWMSLAYQYQGCITPGAAYAVCNYNPGFPFAPGGTAGFIVNWLVESQGGGFLATDTAVTGSGHILGLGMTLEFSPHPSFPGNFIPPSVIISQFPSGAEYEFDTNVLSAEKLQLGFFKPDMGLGTTTQQWGAFITGARSGWSVWSGGVLSIYGNLSKKDIVPDP